MKKILPILLLFVCAIVGCKKNSEEKANNLLVGKWRANKIVLIEPVSQTIIPTSSSAAIEIKEDGTFIDLDSPSGPQRWSYDPNTFVLTVGDIKIRVNKLTKDELYLLYTEVDTKTKVTSKFEIFYERL